MNDTGSKRGELKVNDTDAGDLALYGTNDSLNVLIGSLSGGYFGNIELFDSIGLSNVILRSTNIGGYLELYDRNEAGVITSAILAGTFPNTSGLALFGKFRTADGTMVMVNNYITGNEINNGPEMSGNYNRSGTDWRDNDGRLLATIGNAREEGGSDPTGASGYLSLWGTNSFNVELTGKRWENNDLPIFNMFGSNDGGLRNISLEVGSGSGTNNLGNITLTNTDNGGISQETVFITSDLFEQKGGGIILRDSINNMTVSIDGTSGSIGLNGEFSSSTASIGDFFGGTGIWIDGQAGNIDATGTIAAPTITQSSDQRLKKDIKGLENSLSNTLKLRGTSYYWKDENKPQKRQIGVIAQEIEEVYPEFVHTNNEGFKSVNYAQMTAVLIEAIKELNAMMENTEKAVAELEKVVVGLETENKVLNSALNQTIELEEKINKLEKLMLEDKKLSSK